MKQLTRDTANGTEYFCPVDGWVKPKVWCGTGFRKYICVHCGKTLDDDPFGDLAYENQVDPAQTEQTS